MNKSLYIAALVALISTSVFVACNSNNEQKENADKALSDVKDDISQISNDTIVYSEWSTYKSEAEKTIDNNNMRIQDLKAKIKKQGMPNIDKLREKRIDEIQEQNAALRAKIATYKREQKSEWETFKVDFKKDLDSLSTSIDALMTTKK